MKKFFILLAVAMLVNISDANAQSAKEKTCLQTVNSVSRTEVSYAARGEEWNDKTFWFSALKDDCFGPDMDPNFQDEHGLTMLHVACLGGGPQTIRLLLRNGVRPDLKADMGLTAYDLAKMEGNSKAAQILKGHGAGKSWYAWRSSGTIGPIPTVTSKGFFVTWAGEAYEIRTIDGEFPKEDYSNAEWRIRVTWVSSKAPYHCGQVITKKGSEIKDMKRRSVAMRKCD